MSANNTQTAKTFLLTGEQRAIVEAEDGPMVVLAGAGTGKTRVIVERVRWLLETKGQKNAAGDYVTAKEPPRHGNPFEGPLVPEQLLVLTYNVKAAAELESRLDATAGVGPSVRSRMTVNNFHGFCHRVLSESAAEAELPAMPDVLDGPGQILLLRDLRDQLDLVYHSEYSYGDFATFISRCKDELVWPDDFDRFVANEVAIYEAEYGSFAQAVERLHAAGNLQPLREVAADYRKLRAGKDVKDDVVEKTADREARRTVAGNGKALYLKDFPEDAHPRIWALADTYERDGAALEVLRLKELATTYRKYQAKLTERGALDFGEQIALVTRLFVQRSNLLRRWQRQYRYILVDEFQDANAAQIELIGLLGKTPDRPDNVIVVGDDDQSIYRFRGAAVNAFEDFQRIFDGKPPILHISENFRSGGHVLTGANQLIVNNKDRLDTEKRLRTSKDAGEAIEIHLCNGPEDEAMAIVDAIRTLAGPGKDEDWNSVAVLYRKHAHRELIVERLKSEGIPFTIIGGVSLFELPEIRDLEEGLRAIADPLNVPALVRMMTAGPWRLDAVEILRVTRHADFERIPAIDAVRRIVAVGAARDGLATLDDVEAAEDAPADAADAGEAEAAKTAEADKDAVVVSADTRAKLRQQLAVLDELGQMTWRDGPFTVLSRYVERTSVILDLLGVGTVEAKRSIVNIGSFMRFASDWQQAKPRGTLADFLAYLDAYKSAAGDLPTSVELTEDVEGVRLMTLYQAKGLEFPIVVIPRVVEGEWPMRNMGQGWFPPELLYGKPPTGDTHIEEERRLLYVAMTRAQRRLIVTTFAEGAVAKKGPSSFIGELLAQSEAEGSHLRQVDRAQSKDASALVEARQIIPIASAQERRLSLRLAAAELLTRAEALSPDAADTEEVQGAITAQLANLGKSAALDADQARAQGLDPLTMRAIAVREGEGGNLLQVAPLPPRFSYSSLKTYKECGLRYAFNYLYRIPPPDRKAAPLTFGSAIHSVFEEFTKLVRNRAARGEPVPTRDELGSIFTRNWKPTDFGDAVTATTYERKVGSMLDAFWEDELARPAVVLKEEEPFRLILDPGDGSPAVVITGSIDRIDQHPDGTIEVIDYKTGKPENQDPPDKNQQLAIYAMACRDTLKLGMPALVTLYFTERRLRMSLVPTPEHLDAVRDDILAAVARIRSGDFTVNPDPKERADACRYCDYKAICPERRESKR